MFKSGYLQNQKDFSFYHVIFAIYILFFIFFSFLSINKMFDGKFIATLIALVVAVMTICNFNTKKVSSTEEFGFGGLPSMTWKTERVMAPNLAAVKKGDFYSIPGTYQSSLNPRFSNVDYGANIKYNMPSNEKLAVPCDPLTFGNMAKKSYQEKFTTGAPLMEADYTSGNYKDVISQPPQGVQYPSPTDMMPVGDMTTVNSLGETVQPIVYDRFIYANRNSRLRSHGDPIRGDLPIVPCAAEWFRPSVQPNIDLQQGAMNVLAGLNNETTQAMSELINSTSGDRTIAGVNLESNRMSGTSGSLSTVNVAAFH